MPVSAPTFERLAFCASDGNDAQASLRRLVHVYGNVPAKHADAIVALGGDGFMLETMHRFMNDRIPIYGMNRGTVGFLMNEYREDELYERIARAESTRVHPLAMRTEAADGTSTRSLAINEVSLFRQTHQAAKLRISIDGTERMPELVCDGVLVATPAGSTAYNLSAHGPILPINSPLLAVTAISPFRPRRWRGALLPNVATIQIDVLEPGKRPVAAVADNIEIRSVVRVDVSEERKVDLFMLFDRGHSLDERILSEQFRY